MGNLRTALIAWLAAKSSGRKFLMRVEDLDRARDQGSALSQLSHLEALGITWDGEVLYQTARLDAYRETVAELTARGLTYECYCTRQDILQAPTAPHHPPGSYPGTCRDLSPEARQEARERIGPRRPAIRLRLNDGATTLTFTDLVCGETSGAIDDFVVMRGDETYAYNLVSVIDDAFQRVDQVVRGDDLLLSTPRQIALQQLLGLPRPEYAHVPLVLGPGGKRLAKRDGAVTLPELWEAGLSSDDVLTMLAHSLGLCGESERVTAETLAERFTWSKLRREPWVWSPHHG